MSCLVMLPNVQSALLSLFHANALRVVWIPALCVRSVNTVRKFAYYLLGALLALIPFYFLCLAMVTLASYAIDIYTLSAIFVVLYTLYGIYLVWMFADEDDLM